ncbi:MAG: type IV pilus secretin PilQ [Candidatus Aminicenantia bacterium]
MSFTRKLSILIIIVTSLLLLGYAQEKNKPIEILKVYSTVQDSKTKLIFQTSSFLPLPIVYSSKDNPLTLVIEFENVKVSNLAKKYSANSPLVKEVRIYPLSLNSAKAEIELAENAPYRVNSTSNNLIIEFSNIKKTPPTIPKKEEKNPIVKEKEVKTNPSIIKTLPPATFLQDINIEKNKEEKLRVILKLNGEAIYKCLELNNPERIVIDLFEIINSTPKSEYKVGDYGIARIRTAQFQSDPKIARVVFDMINHSTYKIDKTQDKLIVTFSKPNQETSKMVKRELKKPAPVTAVEKKTPSPIKKKPTPPSTKNIQIKDPIKESIIKEQTQLEKEQSKIEESPPEQEEEESKSKETTPQELFQTKTIAGAEGKYRGEKVTLRFKDADLRDVIIYLGTVAGLNVVFDPGVSGRVTCELVEVPWDQALDIILKSNKLGMVLKGNVLRIASVDTLAREEEQTRRLREAKELAGPVKVRTIPLSYAKAKQIKPVLDRQLSARGEIIFDERSNTLIITDVPERVEIIEKLIATLDVPNPQVSIEARIVEATANFARNLGIQWGFKAVADAYYGNQTSLQFPNSILVDGSRIGGVLARGMEGPLGGYAINLPAPVFDTAIGLSFGNVLDTFRLDIALSALETSGRGRIISAPKVTTQNNMEAEILQGRQIPVQTIANFTVTTRYVNAALELRVTPQITPAGTIIMTIEIRNNAADFANLVQGIPPIITQSAKTTVMVKDGGTTVIGGIYRVEESVTRTRVPLLHKIPLLGNFFKSFSRTTTNRELLIFITPRIIRG